MNNRYDASENQATCQPGSDGRVLQNLLGITSPDEMNDVELDLLEQLYQFIFTDEFPDRRLTVADLKHWHYQWLGNVYAWAGEERSVNLVMDDFHFAAAAQIARLLDEFQQACLDHFTPAHEMEDTALTEALAITHVELILIHPFRDGNGRLARVLADVMSVQAGRGLLDYSGWDSKKESYLAAIQQGMAGGYEPMTALFSGALQA
ncbi:MAG: Fic family protein [Xanthomonadales bacterium]|nr:Fic family protein [Xanthomonadales bacterium]